MFERLKAYKKLDKSDEFLRGCVVMAELTGDDKMLREANEALELNAKVREKMLSNCKIAAKYNEGATKCGF